MSYQSAFYYQIRWENSLRSDAGICEERAEAEGVAPTLSGGGKNVYFPILKLTIGSTFVNRWKA